MADIGTIIIGRSLNRGSKLSLSISTGFDIVACLPFFLAGVIIFGLIMLSLSYLINFWAFSSLICMFLNYSSIIEIYLLRAAT
jgi:hypothetical protein